MTILTQAGNTLTANYGENVTYSDDLKTQNYRAVTIGGTNKPLIQYEVKNIKNSRQITIPSGYNGEPAIAYMNGNKVHEITLL